ncbi:pyridoxal phosphatase [Otariodibacter sp.]|uniref:pyridoxal phosphatase n=1 Tax=Otariodibacter sp. TaxID=3030919 RepID=UPI00260F1F51|nr:pyridoxal phosphatase [Otariodibacter sp.]
MTYEAIAFDLDGTLLSSQSAILESSKVAIKKVREKGIKVFIVTGRHHTAVRPYYKELELDTPVVCCNGTYLYDFHHDEVLSSNPLTTEQAISLVKSSREQGFHIAMYTRDAMTFEVLNPHFEKLLAWVDTCPIDAKPDIHQVNHFDTYLDGKTIIWKVLISDSNSLKMQKYVDNLPLDQFSPEWSWSDRVDITASGNSKGKCLAELLKLENINPENVVAFGDNFNDVSMLESVGMGIAMGNSELEIQHKAKKVIGSNNEDSISLALSELFDL